MNLTTTQLAAIDRHLRQDNWLLNQALIAELTDHYAVAVAEKMSAGATFDVALYDVHTGFGGRKGLLLMEENYQTQNYRALQLLEWKEVRTFIEGSRWPITILIFGIIYGLNHYVQDVLNVGLMAGMGFVSCALLASLVQTIVFFYRTRGEVDVTVARPSSPIFSVAYFLALLLISLNKYVSFGLPAGGVLLLNTIIETLCLVYYTALAICIRRALLASRKPIPKSA